MILAPFLCLVASATDGDTFRCADGARVRLAGIEAAELRGGCHTRTCPRMSGQQAKVHLSRLIVGRSLRCRELGTSYKRVVASCTVNGADLRCTLIQAGAAVDWEAYRVRYRLGACRVGEGG